MTTSKRQAIFSQRQPRIENVNPSSGDSPDETVKTIKTMLQKALIIEFFTIPPYLTALYSIKDKTSQAYQTFRSVVLEEMLHLNLACNLMNSVGGIPKLVGEIWDYPNSMPYQVAGGVYVQLMAASPELMLQTFMTIERPAPLDTTVDDDNSQTIGQFYEALKKEFEKLPPDFKYQTELQRTNLYFGSGGGKAILVENLDTAKEAINQIMQQGEGAVPPNREYQPDQPWGTYNYYGLRSDETYGPILGTPFDLSHFFKFKDLADGTIPIGETYPMLPNPSPEKFQNQWAIRLAEVFNDCYGLLVRALQETFAPDKVIETDPYFAVIVPIMQSIFTTLATQLMQIPIQEKAGTLGPNAGPCFQYSSTSLDELILKVEQLKKELDSAASLDVDLRPIAATVSAVDNTLQDINQKTQGSSLRERL